MLSRTGRFVAFASPASNLVPGDTNGQSDVFVRDRLLGRTSRVSWSSTGEELISGASVDPVISADGRYVAFLTNATNLVPPATQFNWRNDVMVHDRQLGTTVWVNPSPAGPEDNAAARHPSISADGRYVAFSSIGPGIVDDGSDAAGVFVRDVVAGTTRRASVSSTGAAAVDVGEGMISGNGRYVAFESISPSVVAGDTNDAADVFIRDLHAATTERISLSNEERQADDYSYLGTISDSGRSVAFVSYASNLVARDGNDSSDIFLRDLQTGTTLRASASRTGGDADSASYEAQISADGRHVAFTSYATNLVPHDTNGHPDGFVWSAP